MHYMCKHTVITYDVIFSKPITVDVILKITVFIAGVNFLQLQNICSGYHHENLLLKTSYVVDSSTILTFCCTLRSWLLIRLHHHKEHADLYVYAQS